MKKFTAILMTLAMLFVGAFALAEEATTMAPTFEGAYVAIAETGVEVFLPTDWTADPEPEDYYLLMSNADESQMIGILLSESDGMDVATMAENLTANGYTCSTDTINGMEFAMYENAELGIFGAATLSVDGATIIQLVFAPMDNAEIAPMAGQIISSVRPVTAGATEAPAAE